MVSRLWRSLSNSGLLLGTLFFAASLTPSLLPRDFLSQGVLSGLSLVAGYGIGAFGYWLWAYMELPQPTCTFLRVAKLAAVICCAGIAVFSLWHAAEWQNSIRVLMELQPVHTAHPLAVVLIALTVFAILIALARFFLLTLHFMVVKINRFLPSRMSNVIGVIAARRGHSRSARLLP
jgi:uncharacterized membrane protein